MPYQTSQTVKPHHAVCKKTSPNGEPMIGLSTLLSFPVSTSKTKRATAPVNAKIVQYYGPEKIRHNMLELSRIAKFRSKELRFCTTVNWPQKNSAEVMKDQQSINSILPTLLDRRLLQDCECELLPSCITYQDFPSLPKISVQSHGSHTAPGALLTSIIVALWVWKS